MHLNPRSKYVCFSDRLNILRIYFNRICIARRLGVDESEQFDLYLTSFEYQQPDSFLTKWISCSYQQRRRTYVCLRQGKE